MFLSFLLAVVSVATISCPIPIPVVFIPLSSFRLTNKIGLVFVIPPETKFSSFKKGLISAQ